MKQLGEWLERRVGYGTLLRTLRTRGLPDGPSWWLTSASCLFALLLIQGLTGLLLMTSYSPSMPSAWACVHFIDQSSAGSFLRGVHHYAAHAMIILFLIHVARVTIAGAYRAPQELVWVTGLLLIPIVIVWTVTGNPLSGSQKGVAQIEVEANILGSTPLVGPALRKLLIGGDEIGNLTLTHLYFLHVGLFPLIVIVLIAIHLQQVFKHSLYLPETGALLPIAAPRAVAYWPYQTVRNRTVLAGVVGVIAWVAWKYGAPLEAPADPDLPQAPRPEWYFRWLFELRRYFTGEWEFIATMVLPTLLLLFFIFLPFIDRWLRPRTAGILRIIIVSAGLSAWGALTYISFARDMKDPEFVAVTEEAARLSERARFLADAQQVPPEGAQVLLRRDAKTQGPLLFGKHCASCHPHAGLASHGASKEDASAPDLTGFGTANWIAGFLDPERIASKHVFGGTKFQKGAMVRRVNSLFKDAGEEGKQELQANLQKVARALSAEAGLASQKDADARDKAEIEAGRKLLTEEFSCTECHKFHDEGDLGQAPDLTGYGSKDWLRGMIAQPTGARFYADKKNDRMPGFAADSAHPEQNLLSPGEMNLLVEWLRGEWLETGEKSR
ncbi:MAG: cytochrome b N-terminal domain-containing protein [Planctomycetales bacterium]